MSNMMNARGGVATGGRGKARGGAATGRGGGRHEQGIPLEVEEESTLSPSDGKMRMPLQSALHRPAPISVIIEIVHREALMASR
jgi:hypothetical protein